MAILVTLHAIQAVRPQLPGDHILCWRDGVPLAPRGVLEPLAATLFFAQAGQQHSFNRTLIIGAHGDSCAVTLLALTEHGEEITLGCVKIAIEQSSLGFSECVEAAGAITYGGREGKHHRVDVVHGERHFRLLFRAQLVTDL